MNQSKTCLLYTSAILLIVFVNQVDDYFYHYIFFLSSAFCNHQSQGNECVAVSYTHLDVYKRQLFFITAFAMMSVGNAAGAYFMNDLEQQTPLAQEGIRWLVCVIPAILLGLAMFIISKYELTDEVIDDINKKIEARHKEEN